MRTWRLSAKLSVRKSIRALALGAIGLVLVPGGAVAQDLIGGRFTWDGSENGLWADAGNWTIGRPPGPNADLTFPASGFWHTTVNNYASGAGFGLITYTGAGYEVFGNPLVLMDGVRATHATGVTSFGADIILGADASFLAQDAGTTLNLGGLLTLGGSYAATFDGAGLVQVSNIIRRAPGFGGGVSIIKEGAGTTLLTKSNDLSSGQVWVRTGTLALAHNFALGDAGTTIVLEGATLALGGNLRLDSGPIGLAGTLRSDLGANVVSDMIALTGSNAIFAVPTSLTVSGVVAGASGFIMMGGGTLRFAANNTYSGPTLLKPGLLIVDGSQPSSPIQLDGGT
ncbi:MAG TPA: hypothetical protein VJS65_11375, partial [Verrucomicrobiae bacterium]|nr:hypothetical protein [Verrucomicrobiae bacterium]